MNLDSIGHKLQLLTSKAAQDSESIAGMIAAEAVGVYSPLIVTQIRKIQRA